MIKTVLLLSCPIALSPVTDFQHCTLKIGRKAKLLAEFQLIMKLLVPKSQNCSFTPSDSGYKGLWRDPTHLAERSHCLNHLAAIYGGSPLPLVYSDLAMVPTQRAMTKWTQLL